MKIKLNKEDTNKLHHLFTTLENNVAVANMLLEFCEHYDFIDKNKFILAKDKKQAFAYEFLHFFDIELQDASDYELFNNYIKPAIALVDTKIIENNPYYLNVKPQKAKYGKYELFYKTFHALQPFVYKDITFKGDFYQELSSISFFEKDVAYLAISSDDVTWMSITPNEIVTMQRSIEEAHGDVLTFGLGLGYYPYMVAQKENVKSVIIVENDKNIINLFKKNILPLFNNKNKIKIIESDAFEYCKNTDISSKFDYAFMDIWHSPIDGLPLYIRFKQLEKEGKCHYSYWLKDSLIASFRRLLITTIEEQYKGLPEKNYLKAKNEEDKIINNIYFQTKNLVISSFEEIVKLCDIESINALILGKVL